jgi:hypothetical protein
LSNDLEEIVLARVDLKINQLFEAKSLRIGKVKTFLEGQKDINPIFEKILDKLDEFIESRVNELDMEGARKFFGLSSCLSLKNLKEFFGFQSDSSAETFEQLLKVYYNHIAESNMIKSLDELKADFIIYLVYKKSYLENHPEHNQSYVPSEVRDELKALFIHLLAIEGIDAKKFSDLSEDTEEAILFYSLNPNCQAIGELAQASPDNLDELLDLGGELITFRE